HLPDRLDDLREVAVHRLAVARLEIDIVAFAEDDRAEAVELRLVDPAVALGQLLGRLRQLRRDRRLERERHSITSFWARRPCRASGAGCDRQSSARGPGT